MQNIVIGVYDDYSQAQKALNDLLANGFAAAEARLSPAEQSPSARDLALAGDSAEQSGWSLGKLFHSLFGDNDASEHHRIYAEAVRRGSYLLTVETDSEARRDRATDILNRYGPIDIDERSSQWRTRGWSQYDRGAATLSDEEIAREPMAGAEKTRGAARAYPRAAGGATTDARPDKPDENEQ